VPDHIVRTKVYSPAAVGAGETVQLFEVPRGYRVKSASGAKLILAAAGTNSTMTLGDGADVDGYVTTADLDLETGAVGDLFDGTGAYFNSAGGKLYTTKDTVDVVYTPNGTPGAVLPRVEFAVTFYPEWALQ
jgi:hypothetical protein